MNDFEFKRGQPGNEQEECGLESERVHTMRDLLRRDNTDRQSRFDSMKTVEVKTVGRISSLKTVD